MKMNTTLETSAQFTHDVLPFNSPGRFQTLEVCEGCGMCLRYARDMMTFDESDVFCYVYRQPKTEEDFANIMKARLLCQQSALADKNDFMERGME